MLWENAIKSRLTWNVPLPILASLWGQQAAPLRQYLTLACQSFCCLLFPLDWQQFKATTREKKPGHLHFFISHFHLLDSFSGIWPIEVKRPGGLWVIWCLLFPLDWQQTYHYLHFQCQLPQTPPPLFLSFLSHPYLGQREQFCKQNKEHKHQWKGRCFRLFIDLIYHQEATPPEKSCTEFSDRQL